MSAAPNRVVMRLLTYGACAACFFAWKDAMGWPGAIILGCIGGACLADAFQWVRGSRKIHVLNRPRYWWDLDPRFKTRDAYPACACCMDRPDDFDPWEKWQLFDGLYRCPNCHDRAEPANLDARKK